MNNSQTNGFQTAWLFATSEQICGNLISPATLDQKQISENDSNKPAKNQQLISHSSFVTLEADISDFESKTEYFSVFHMEY